MSIEELLNLFSRILAVEKAAGKKEPVYYAGFARAALQTKAILNHADTEIFPDELFKERAPNQTPEQHKYVKANYKCTTNPVWQDYLTVQARIWFNSNWSITWNEESREDEGFQAYAEENFPKWRSIEAYVKNIIVPMKAMDANGVVAVHPTFSYIETEDGLRVDDLIRAEPRAYYYPSNRVLHRSEDLYMCVSTEKSEVINIAGKPEKVGRVIYAYTKQEIYRIQQTGKASENTYLTDLLYQHDEGIIPAHDLMGSPVLTEDGKVYWRSPFYFAVPLLDFALTTRNILQVSIAGCAFPFRVLRASPCDYEDGNHNRCIGGSIFDSATGNKSTCPSCNGLGHRVPVSPTGEYQWTEPQGLDEGKGMSYKPVEYIEPGTGQMTFVREQAEIDTDKARGILHLHTSANAAKGSPDITATQSAMDYSTQFAFLQPIADQTFDLFEFIMARVCFQRYESYDQMPTIVRPQSYDLRTEGQLWVDIKTARDAGAPPFVIQTIFHDLIMNRLSSDLDAQRLAMSVMVVDDLFTLTTADVVARKANGTVEAWQIAFHHSSYQMVMRLMQEDPNWITLDDKERADALRAYAIENAPIVPVIGSGIEGILSGLGG